MKNNNLKKFATFIFAFAMFVTVFFAVKVVAFADETELSESAEAIDDTNSTIIDTIEKNKDFIAALGSMGITLGLAFVTNSIKKKATVNALSNISLNGEIKSQSGVITAAVSKIEKFDDKLTLIEANQDTILANQTTILAKLNEQPVNTASIKINLLSEMLYKAYMHSSLDESVKASIEGLYNSIVADNSVYEAQLTEMQKTIDNLNKQLTELK